MRFSLRKKIVALTCLAALLPLAVATLITLYVSTAVNQSIDQEVDKIVLDELGHTVSNLYGMCEAANEAMQLSGTNAPGPNQLAGLRKAFTAVKFGKSGYAWALGGHNNPGQYYISKDGLRDGESILNSKDETGRFFVRDVLSKALSVKPGVVFFDRLMWRNPGENNIRIKINAYTYYAPWDWVIGAGLYEDDFDQAKLRINHSLEQILWALGLSGGVILILAVLSSLLLANRMSAPLKSGMAILAKMAEGDVRGAREALKESFDLASAAAKPGGRDEQTALGGSLLAMIEGVEMLVEQVRRSGFQVAASVTSIAASARQIEAGSSELTASAAQVSASSQEISSTSLALSESMDQAMQALRDTSQLAGSSRKDLERMSQGMLELGRATAGVRAKLAVLNSKAEKISGVSETIGKIADQTNMLSLNAGIEAEKAGEYGHGFSVVAREMRRLADLTAQATLDIERMLEEMRTAVAREIREMEGFSGEVGRAVDEVTTAGNKMGGIIEQVGGLSPHFEEIKSGMQAQSEAASQISLAIRQLSDTALQGGQTIEEFRKVTDRLSEAVQGLQKGVSRFNVGQAKSEQGNNP